jgi:hypothetical protein
MTVFGSGAGHITHTAAYVGPGRCVSEKINSIFNTARLQPGSISGLGTREIGGITLRLIHQGSNGTSKKYPSRLRVENVLRIDGLVADSMLD